MTFNRRHFLKSGSCALMCSTPMINTIINLKMASAAVSTQKQDDYKALVCILLSGGNDSWNMLIPADKEPYHEYANTRDSLALPLSGPSAALTLTGNANGGKAFATHPACTQIQSLYDEGEIAFVANVGTLIEKTSIKDYRTKSSRLPRSLFSHLDQRAQWQTSVPQSDEKSGWLGRASEALLESTVNASDISMNISLAGNNLLQTGATSSTPYNITRHGSLRVEVPWVRELFNRQNQENLFQSEYANLSRDSIDLEKIFSQAFQTSTLNTTFPKSNKLAHELEAVAKTIVASQKLGHQRQTFFVSVDGWDNHQDLLSRHDKLLHQLDEALGAFNAALHELNYQDQVTTFTVSDFGRALVSNGDGTDHGWGGNALVMGGAVNGGQILGDYPETLRPKSGLDVGQNGRLLPTTACDEYFYELLEWFGVAASDFEFVLPNLNNFLDVKSGVKPIGLFSGT